MTKIVIAILFFALGFLINQFSYNLTYKSLPDNFKAQSDKVLGKKIIDEFKTYVNYNGSFEPKTVLIKKGNYIAITNKSRTEQLWLLSDNSALNTPRGYAEGERLEAIMNQKGTFYITNKNKTGTYVKIIVAD